MSLMVVCVTNDHKGQKFGKILRCTDQAPLSYALPNEEPAGHLNADNHIYGSLKRVLFYSLRFILIIHKFQYLAHCPFPESLTLKISHLKKKD